MSPVTSCCSTTQTPKAASGPPRHLGWFVLMVRILCLDLRVAAPSISAGEVNPYYIDFQSIQPGAVDYRPVLGFSVLGDHFFGQSLRVSLPGFDIAVTETSVKDFIRFVDATGYVTQNEQGNGWCLGVTASHDKISLRKGDFNWRKPGFTQTSDEPVICVSHADATSYCEWLTRETRRVHRLPTSAEWQLARTYQSIDGNMYDFPIGADPGRFVNVLDTSYSLVDTRFKNATFDDHRVFTTNVTSKELGISGLRFLHGNVGEICNCDSCCAVAVQKDCMVIRGEDWQTELNKNNAVDQQVALKINFSTATTGFRIVRESAK